MRHHCRCFVVQKLHFVALYVLIYGLTRETYFFSFRYFLLVESAGLYVYTYDGKFVCSPKWAGMRPDMLNRFTVALSNSIVAVRDKADERGL